MAEETVKCIVCNKEVSAKECCTWDMCKDCHGGTADVEHCNRKNALTLEQQDTVRSNRTSEEA